MADRAGSEFKVIHGEPWVVNADLNALDADGWEVVGVSSAPHWRAVMLSVLMGNRHARDRAAAAGARSSVTCRCSGLGPPSRLCRGHQSTLLSNHRTHKRLQRIACRPNAILFSDPLPNQLCPLRVAGVAKQGVQLAGGPAGVVAMGETVRATPNRVRRAALSGWSWAKGTTSIGFPDRIARPVVPTPPWWTITADRGNSTENGAYSTAITPSGSEGGRLRGSLSTSTARRPSRSAARRCSGRSARRQ